MGGCGYLTRWPTPDEAHRSLEKLLAQDQGGESLWANGWLRIEKGGERVSFAAELLLAPPDRLRLTAFGLFDRPEAYLTSDGRRLRLYLPGQDSFYEGPAEGALLSHLIGLPPIEIADLVGFLRGRVPVDPGATAQIGRDRWRSRWVARMGPVANERRLFFSITGSRLLGFESARAGGGLVVGFSEFGRARPEGPLRPYRIEIAAPRQRTTLRVSLREIEEGAPADRPDLFKLSAPAGTPVRPFGEAAGLLGRRWEPGQAGDVDPDALAVVRPSP